MNVQEAYNNWSVIYDTNKNKTRDLEGVALRQVFECKTFDAILEIGCGTGKNSEWLMTKTPKLIGIDFSEDMLGKAKEKIKSDQVQFIWADIKNDWQFETMCFDLVTCSLVLEHIDDLDHVFNQAKRVLTTNGLIYIGELHPFKQYLGSKARFETADGVYVLECYTHHISDFCEAAARHDFDCILVNEWFDDDVRTDVPRILSLVFVKK
jgi:ubiquinone/menaquinone biosynthesis C-methylase UbiE